ncbi:MULTISPECIES: rhodanese-like domain-containing protein [unclassified Olleya]|uniref:rhodanese-like domain-containing protein n=1 Tax=unclassified Olleya TaxID=2615019 RepID=UPI000C3131FE|nr:MULTISPECIES: rhodanese-like domain-containing protein [unclassified Olleya]AUC77576.1 rhodanese-like domain-containing protein [Olleya sp. Bg11-27]QXP59939.1 rhodanese-like domain-containing protein [Olleya sp. HaHaR_3_96]
MKKITIVLSLILAVVFSCSEQAVGEIKTVSPEEMQTLLQLDNVQLVDVRTAKEHEAGYIAMSQNIDFMSPTFDKDIQTLDKEKPVMLYCQKGGRSAKCAEKMIDLGFKKIYDMKGGFSKWEHEGLPYRKK